MKCQTPQPKILVSSIYKLLSPFQFNSFVPEQGTEKQYFKRHPCYEASSIMRALDTVSPDPGQTFLLPANSGYMEWNRYPCPFYDAIYNSNDEYGQCHIRYNNTEDDIPDVYFIPRFRSPLAIKGTTIKYPASISRQLGTQPLAKILLCNLTLFQKYFF